MADANVTDANITKALTNSVVEDATYAFETSTDLLKNQKYAIHEYITIINDIKNACIRSKLTTPKIIKGLCSIYTSHLTFIKWIKNNNINTESKVLFYGILYATLLDLLHLVIHTKIFEDMNTLMIADKQYTPFIVENISNIIGNIAGKYTGIEEANKLSRNEKNIIKTYVESIQLQQINFNNIKTELESIRDNSDTNLLEYYVQDEFIGYINDFFFADKFFTFVNAAGRSPSGEAREANIRSKRGPPPSAAEAAALAAALAAAPIVAPPPLPSTLPQLEIIVDEKTKFGQNAEGPIFALGINSRYNDSFTSILNKFGCTYVVDRLRLDSDLYFKGIKLEIPFGIYKINDEDVSKATIETINDKIETAYNKIPIPPLKLTLVYKDIKDKEESEASINRKRVSSSADVAGTSTAVVLPSSAPPAPPAPPAAPAAAVDPNTLPQLEYTISLKDNKTLGIKVETNQNKLNEFGCTYVAKELLPDQILAQMGFTTPFGVYKVNDIDVSKMEPENIRKQIKEESNKSNQVKLILVYLTEADKKASLHSIATVTARASGKFLIFIDIPAGSALGIDESSKDKDEIDKFGSSYVVTTLVKSRGIKEKYLDKIGIKVPFGISTVDGTDVSKMMIKEIENLFITKQSQGFELALIYLDENLQKESLKESLKAINPVVAPAVAPTAADQKLQAAQAYMIAKSNEMETVITTNNVKSSDKTVESARQETIVKAKDAAWKSRDAFIKEWNTVNTKDNKINNKMNIEEVWRAAHSAMTTEGMAAFNNITAKVHWSGFKIKRDNAGDTTATAAAPASVLAQPPAAAPPPAQPIYQRNSLEQINAWLPWYNATIQWIINNPDINTYSKKIKDAKSAFYTTYTAFEKDKKNMDKQSDQVGAAVTAFIEDEKNFIKPNVLLYSDKLNEDDTNSLKASFLKHYNVALKASVNDTVDLTVLTKKQDAVKTYKDFKKAWDILIGSNENKLQLNTQGGINENFIKKSTGFGSDSNIDERNKYMDEETIKASQKIAEFPKKGGGRYSRKRTSKASTKKTRKNRNY